MHIPHHRPVEDAIIAAEELDHLGAMLEKAGKMTSKRREERDRTRAYFLLNQLGMSQAEIAAMAGISEQAIQQRINNFWYWLRVAYKKPGGL